MNRAEGRGEEWESFRKLDDQVSVARSRYGNPDQTTLSWNEPPLHGNHVPGTLWPSFSSGENPIFVELLCSFHPCLSPSLSLSDFFTTWRNGLQNPGRVGRFRRWQWTKAVTQSVMPGQAWVDRVSRVRRRRLTRLDVAKNGCAKTSFCNCLLR